MDEKITVKKFFATVAYAFKVIFSASKAGPALKILFMLLKSTLPFINVYILNDLLNSLTADVINTETVMSKAFLLVGFTVIQSLSNRIMGIVDGIFNEKITMYCKELFMKKQMVLPL